MACKLFLLIAITVLLSGCPVEQGSDNSGVTPTDNDEPDLTVDQQLRVLIDNNGLTGDPSLGRDIPDINDPLPQLGKKLFFTKALGGQYDSACVTCHHPLLGGGDALALSVGSDADDPDLLGPGRYHNFVAFAYDGGPTIPRNSPSTFNAALWDKVMFWDGKVESLGKTPGANGNDGLGIGTPDSDYGQADPLAGLHLPEAQARFPVASPVEMKGFIFESRSDNEEIRTHLASRVGGYGSAAHELPTNYWLQEFQTGYNSLQTAEELITFTNIVRAISAYERTQLFINNPWRAYVEGDESAITDSAKRGALLFFTPIAEGGAGCNVCHMGDFLTDELFHVIATIQVGRGKGDGATLDNDYGRFGVTDDPADLFKFRTPTLLNVEVTGPWGHAGSYSTLESIIRHYVDPRDSLQQFDASQHQTGLQVLNVVTNTNEALDHLDQLRLDGVAIFDQNVALEDDQITDLIAFLHSLTDPCTKDEGCMSPWLPVTEDIDPDNLRLNAIFQ